jgi:peptidoglycan/xylan/chitin deacetylase (PgdA/CDA1 family)
VTVTLTFDNGPDPKVTPYVLDVLRERNIRATFFMLGAKLRERNRRVIAERVVAEGHWIGNHTFSHHVQFGQLQPPEDAAGEIARTQSLIGELAGQEKFFRPFGGGGVIDRNLLNAAALTYLRHHRFTVVLWTCVPRDWEGPGPWSNRAIEEIRGQKESVVVLHDLPTGAMGNLQSFIDRVEAQKRPFVQGFPDRVIAMRNGVPTKAGAQIVS